MVTKNIKGFCKIAVIYLSCAILLGQAQAMEEDDRNWTPRTAKDFASRKGQEYLRELESRSLAEQNYLLVQEAWKNEKRNLLAREALKKKTVNR